MRRKMRKFTREETLFKKKEIIFYNRHIHNVTNLFDIKAYHRNISFMYIYTKLLAII